MFTPSREYEKMEKDWKLGCALWQGTETMRCPEWLPQEDGESDLAYNARLKRSYLYPGYKSTIQRLAGQVFFRPVVVSNVPKELEYLEYDFDGEDRTITEVAHKMLVQMLRFGKAHGLIDYPSESHSLSAAEERAYKIRPYFTSIDPRDLFAWSYEKKGGLNVLKNIRIGEYSIEEDENWKEHEVSRVRVFFPDGVEIYRLEENDWVLESSFPYTLGKIPLVTAYAAPTGFLTAEPPLKDLEWLNLRHFQSTSDQNNILHVARVPIFFAKGFEEGELSTTVIGSHRGVVTTSENASIEYIEHTGAAIEAGRQDLMDIKKQMHETGADLLVSRSVDRQTASARSIDRAESMANLNTMVISLETALKHCYELAGEWLGVDASDVNVSVSDEFGLPVESNSTHDLEHLLENGRITEEEFRYELKRRGILSEHHENSAT